MSLNLLTHSWIPVIRDGVVVTIRPDQITDSGISALAWPRADFNLACLELLIGLVSMADPPKDESDRFLRLHRPDERLRGLLMPFAEYFELAGNGPRFLQDLEAFEQEPKPSIKSVDMLFIDSAGESSNSKNADLMVKRGRFATLSAAEAAMALYTLQAFAPSGGAGNRTSMRGGGPMTTLVQPVEDLSNPSLWRVVFANALPGEPLSPDVAVQALPWLRPTRTSKKGQKTTPDHSHRLEAFFGMPRRLRLVFDADSVTGAVQRPYGTNYHAWAHPLTPYYRQKKDAVEWLPKHPKAGRLSYRNWLGTIVAVDGDGIETMRSAETVRRFSNHSRAPDFEILAGGWAMDNMKPTDFSLHEYPGFKNLGDVELSRVHALVEAANVASFTLRNAFKDVWNIGKSFTTAVDAVIESFYAETEEKFVQSVNQIIERKNTEVEILWKRLLRETALKNFDDRILGGLADNSMKSIGERVQARKKLFFSLEKGLRKELGLENSGMKEAS